jgi:hypothetical protein
MKDDFILHAQGMMCIKKKSTNQPLVGTLFFNSFHAEPSFNTLNETISTIIHEVFHSLFFERTIFRSFPLNSNGLSAVFEDEKGTHQIRSDHFINFSREHFNCIFFYFDN